MRTYRLYRIDGSGRIESGTVIDASDDDDAIAQASVMLEGRRGELWLGQKLVNSFPANR
ncbi:MAG TPA: hypothetical protein VM346_07155 [Sphingomicrobium sp.]|jgi:hypothetical protein|nr:hypothetical protein [Sphingomicrobium sp.]